MIVVLSSCSLVTVDNNNSRKDTDCCCNSSNLLYFSLVVCVCARWYVWVVYFVLIINVSGFIFVIHDNVHQPSALSKPSYHYHITLPYCIVFDHC